MHWNHIFQWNMDPVFKWIKRAKNCQQKHLAKNEIVWIIICINNSTHIRRNSRHMPHLKIKHHQPFLPAIFDFLPHNVSPFANKNYAKHRQIAKGWVRTEKKPLEIGLFLRQFEFSANCVSTVLFPLRIFTEFISRHSLYFRSFLIWMVKKILNW